MNLKKKRPRPGLNSEARPRQESWKLQSVFPNRKLGAFGSAPFVSLTFLHERAVRSNFSDAEWQRSAENRELDSASINSFVPEIPDTPGKDLGTQTKNQEQE